ncbi:hypothetical protein MTO96_037971 [Rhipicephalus appendiculatus]
MPSPTGTEAVQALYAAPAVELLSMESPSVAPILVTRDEEGYRTRPSKGKRITWLLTEPPQEAKQWDIPCSVPTLLVLAITLSLVAFTIFILLRELMKDQDDSQEESTSEGEVGELNLRLAPLNVRERSMVPLPSDATLRLPPLVSTIRPAPPVLASAPDAPAYSPPALRKVCLASDSVHSLLSARGDRLALLSSPAPCCDAILLCCSTINDNLTLQPPPMQTDSPNTHESLRHSTHCQRKTARKVIMGVRITEAEFSRLLAEKRTGRSSFFRSVLRSMNISGFNGLAILLQDIPESSGQSVASVIGSLSEKLRRHSYTLALLLPYKVGHDKGYGKRLRGLKKVLVTPDRLFLYPDARMLGNATLWPSPSEVGFPSHQDIGGSGISICHLFTRQPFLVSLGEACDASKIQAIAKTRRPYLGDVAYSCSLWNQSWASRAYRYNTYTCSGRTGILYQTREQAQTFYRGLVTRVRSLCYSLVDWDSEDFPSVCLRNKPPTENVTCFRKDCFLRQK